MTRMLTDLTTNRHGGIDALWKHPIHGLLPTTLTQDEVEAVDGPISAYTAPVIDYAKALVAERQRMSCTPLQGKLAIGETLWTGVVAYSATAPWAQQMVVDSSDVWCRNSQDIQFIGYLLGVIIKVEG